jgi:flagellar basal-body rod protein FlgG
MFSIIKSGMATATHELSVVSNNVANASSHGFKKSVTSFADIASASHRASLPATSAGLGAFVEGTRAVHSQSAITSTDKKTDLALSGDGYFMVRNPSREGLDAGSIEFTRNGSFAVDAEGYLTTPDGANVLGYPLVDKGFAAIVDNPNAVAPIQIPFTFDGASMSSLDINSDGQISAIYGNADPVPISTIALGTFSNPGGLKQVGNSRYMVSGQEGALLLGAPSVDGFGALQVGGLEASNVDITDELTSMIKAQQQFNGAARLLQSSSEMIEKLTR